MINIQSYSYNGQQYIRSFVNGRISFITSGSLNYNYGYAAASSANCMVSASPINFGVYNPLTTEAALTSSVFNVNCENNQAVYTIKILPEDAARVRDRQLNNSKAGSNDKLVYNLFLDAGRNLYFGDGTGGTSAFSGSGTTLPIYARIAPRQKVGVGSYTNTLNFEVTF